MEKINFSIILPSYNNFKLFKEALESILKQKDVSFEIIICDDSEDNYIEEYVKSIHYNHIIYSHNIAPTGAVKNWNYGLEKAHGQYVMILHHDERMDNPNHLYEAEQRFMSGSDIIVAPIKVYCNQQRYKHILRNPLIRSVFIHYPKLLFLSNAIGPCACIIFRRKLLQYFNPKLSWLVDSEWYYRLLHKAQLSILSNQFPIISIHGHDNQITYNIDTDKAFKKDYIVIHQLYPKDYLIRILLYISYWCHFIKKKIQP